MCGALSIQKVSDDPGRRLAEAQATRDILLATAAEFPDAVVLLGGDLNDTPSSPPLEALEILSAMLRVGGDRPLSSITTYSWNGMDQAIDHLLVVLSSARASYLLGLPPLRSMIRHALGSRDQITLHSWLTSRYTNSAVPVSNDSTTQSPEKNYIHPYRLSSSATRV